MSNMGFGKENIDKTDSIFSTLSNSTCTVSDLMCSELFVLSTFWHERAIQVHPDFDIADDLPAGPDIGVGVGVLHGFSQPLNQNVIQK